MLPCTHKYHISCLKQLIGQKQHIKCSICGVIYGQLLGDQPDGDMTINIDKNTQLQGYKDASGVIVINYSMKSGSRNGVQYEGTKRRAYLPNNDQGKEVLELFKIAFERKLIFTVGRSVTTGLDNRTVWNGIHHKTSLTGGSASFGYPDQTYLKRVKEELALKGITIDCLKEK